MRKIKTLYFINHSHTDIGFTDYQSVCLRQHMEFIDHALDLCEQTIHYPKEARSKWVCEVTGVTEMYLKHASSKNIDRFIKLNKEGVIDVAGMQYNFTPLLNMEQMIRSLYPIKRMRDEYGIHITTAMNCDVDGASWMFADLLPQLGIELFIMSINPVRGYTPKPRPSAFWWEGTAGNKLLVWNGYHYLYGSLACLGNLELAEKRVPEMVKKLEDDPAYPYDFMFLQTTNPYRVDNGPVDVRLPEFVKKWNESGRTPRMELITLTDFNRILRDEITRDIQTLRGDWTDWWCDGVASSSFETGLNRATHEVLHNAEFVESWLRALDKLGWDASRFAEIYENATLYDEHSWGSFGSIETPDTVLARSQWNNKAGRAYFANAEAHDVLARAGKRFAETKGEKDDPVAFDLGHLPPEIAKPAEKYTELLVLNSLPFERKILIEEPVRRSGHAPVGMLEMNVPRGITWGVKSDLVGKRVEGVVPGFGYSFIPLTSTPKGDDLHFSKNQIENAYYRITIDDKTGGLCEWYDKQLKHDFVGVYHGYELGQYVYETVESEKGRESLFESDWFHEDFGTRPLDTPFMRSTVNKVAISKPQITGDRAKISVCVEGNGMHPSTCEFALSSHQRTLEVNWLVDKLHMENIESVYIVFPFNLKKPDFLADINGIPIIPDKEQLNGSVRDFYPVQRWVSVSDDEKGVIISPIDAPLMQLGGITIGKWAASLRPESPTVMSWAMNNHWMVNFKASQGGKIPLRYKLTTYGGKTDIAHCSRFGSEAHVDPVVIRDVIRYDNVHESGCFMKLDPSDGWEVDLKPAEDGQGIIVRIQNLLSKRRACKVFFPEFKIQRMEEINLLEEYLKGITVADNECVLDVAPRAITCFRIILKR